MKIVKSIKIILILLILIICFFQIKKFFGRILTSDNYFIECDQRFSQQLSSNIVEFINKNLKKKLPADFVSTLKKQFPIIETVILQRKNYGYVNVTVKSTIPLYKINYDLVFSNNKMLFPKSYFAENLVESLDGVEIKNLDPNSKEIMEFLNSLSNEIAKNYQIVWLSKNRIELKDKHDEIFTYLITYNLKPDQKILDTCHRILQNLLEQNQKGKKKKYEKLFADLRFANQIVIFSN